jgi:hypothetical protein
MGAVVPGNSLEQHLAVFSQEQRAVFSLEQNLTVFSLQHHLIISPPEQHLAVFLRRTLSSVPYNT